MRTITKYEPKAILESHQLWLRGEGGERANLRSANLSYADLSYADLRSANLSYADLSYADLRSASLRSASLRYADLRDANLRGSFLNGCDLRYANLNGCDLNGCDLRYANLRGSFLNGSDLRGSDLRGSDMITATANFAIGNMREIKTLLLDVWPVTYTATHLHIGCERHLITEWWDFDDDRIARMDSNALEWWKKWKPVIQQIIEMSPAVPTGREESDAAA